MTCIVGIVDKANNRVFIGGDSAGSTSSNIFIIKQPKVFRNGDFIIGGTSSFRMIQLLMYSFMPPQINNKEPHEYMCTDFIDAIRECFKKGGYMKKETEGDERGGFFLVGFKDRLFKIEDDFQVSETLNGIDACGSGEDFALGALTALEGFDIPTDQKVLKALECAAFLSIGVSAPFKILAT